MKKEKFVEAANEIICMKDTYENGGEIPKWITYQELDVLEDTLSLVLMRMDVV